MTKEQVEDIEQDIKDVENIELSEKEPLSVPEIRI